MCKLTMYSTACRANEGPKICAYILWSQIITVDTSSIWRKLHETPYNFLILLFFLPASHFRPQFTNKETLELQLKSEQFSQEKIQK